MAINKQVKINDICYYVEGYVNPPVDKNIFFNQNGMSWIKVSDLIHGSYINFSKHHLSEVGQKLAKNSMQIFKKGSIVWSKSGTIGLTSILNIDVMANRGILNIKPKNNKVLNSYLFYFLCKNKMKFAEKGVGAVLKHFYGPNLMSEFMNLPKKEEQQKIIDIIEPLESLEKMILQFVNNIEKIFLNRHLNIQEFIYKNINWKTNGYSYKDNEKNLDGKYKIFTIRNINNSSNFMRTNLLNNNLINVGDVITGLSGTIGTATIIYQNNWVSNQRTLALRTNIPLNIKISIEKQVNFLLKNSTGAVQKNITVNDVLNLRIIEEKVSDELINRFYIKLLLLKNEIKKIKNLEINLLIK